ncbi:MAG: glycoside hydrolase family 15 protein [Bdellovibrionaceae bacterium]|nr:glycoside hydrolase family 15 protein [Pseudobdellovibrionaceae bacterium]
MKLLLFVSMVFSGSWGLALSLDAWVQSQSKISLVELQKNISPAGSAPGTIVASPSRDNPNYYFHWTRDAGLVMTSIIAKYESSTGAERKHFSRFISDFIQLSRQQQLANSAEGIGEPRFNADGSPDTIPWNRPQYDGPALRALSVLKFLNIPSELPASADQTMLRSLALSVLRTDLSYIAEKWNLPSFDLWEELLGFHFYTQVVQASALNEGIRFFVAANEPDFADQLRAPSDAIRINLAKHWDLKRGYIGASYGLQQAPDSPYKASNLDTAVILGILHGPGIYELSDDQALSTLRALEAAFATEYKINKGNRVPAIGRFTDDIYFHGNPWYMTTAAFAEYYFKLASELSARQAIQVNASNSDFYNAALSFSRSPARWTLGKTVDIQSVDGQRLIKALHKKGDAYLRVLKKYVGSQGEMSEQFDREAGVPVSAPHLTWSYASFLTATSAREKLISDTRKSHP